MEKPFSKITSKNVNAMLDYSQWEEVPEEMIVQAAEAAEEMGWGPPIKDKMNFRRILQAGNVFKKAGLTPIFVWCDETSRLAVYADEYQTMRLH
jgi:hypothetical protein